MSDAELHGLRSGEVRTVSHRQARHADRRLVVKFQTASFARSSHAGSATRPHVQCLGPPPPCQISPRLQRACPRSLPSTASSSWNIASLARTRVGLDPAIPDVLFGSARSSLILNLWRRPCEDKRSSRPQPQRRCVTRRRLCLSSQRSLPICVLQLLPSPPNSITTPDAITAVPLVARHKWTRCRCSTATHAAKSGHPDRFVAVSMTQRQHHSRHRQTRCISKSSRHRGTRTLCKDACSQRPSFLTCNRSGVAQRMCPRFLPAHDGDNIRCLRCP